LFMETVVMKRLVSIAFCVIVMFLISARPAPAQSFQEGKPLDWPVAMPAGPSTWLLGQPYGNTTGAFARGSMWYSAGQRLHFGIDISMPCGTPLVAVAEGEVRGVDDLGFGSGPHNLILRHEAYGITTLYGHLLERPPLVNGQWVERGQVVGLSGDPDGTCDSRPHLHLEVRSLDYFTAYNPVEYINAAWHSLSTVGSYSEQVFQRDLDNPRRWLTLLDQPTVAFGGGALNNYAAAWPSGSQPPANPPLPREASPLPENATVRQRRLGYEGCCFWPWWHATDPNLLYTIDGPAGQRANVYAWQIGPETTFDIVQQAPPPFTSPDGSYELRLAGDMTAIYNTATGEAWAVPTNGEIAALSPDNSRLLWLTRDGLSIPGSEPPLTQIWISGARGENPQMIAEQRGGSARWLDSERVLITTSERQVSTLQIYHVADGSTYELGRWTRLRGLDVAPGGGRLIFYLTFQDDPQLDGVYVIDTQPGAVARQLPWFGAWKWRDASSVYYIPFQPDDNLHSLAYYDLETGENRMLVTPDHMAFTVANGDWSVSADGQRIVYLNANDLTMWLLEIQ